MNSETLSFIFINAVIINNFLLIYFLGICSFLGVTNKLDTAWRMGVAVTFVMVVSSACAYGVHAVLAYYDALYLQLIAYIVVIASAVQIVEMFIKKTSPALFRALGIFLPLITTNCAVLAIALIQTSRQYNFAQSLVFAVGGGIGYSIAMVIMAGIREELELADVPDIVDNAALLLIIAGILSMAFMGFSGLGG